MANDPHSDFHAWTGHEHDPPCAGYPDIVGTPHSDAQHWEQQTTDFSCAVEAQRGIIEAMTGESVTEAQLCTEAAERGWLTSVDGTATDHTGNLLELHGVPIHRETDAKLGDIFQELVLGHKVIVGVKAEDLWHANNPFRDWGGPGANHAIWVTCIDKIDPDDVKVTINDSGDPNGAGRVYRMDQFMDAWEDSGYFYVATDHAPPNLHDSVADFDPRQGLFPEMVDWLHDHVSNAENVMLDLAILSNVMDISSRFKPTDSTPAMKSCGSNGRVSSPARQADAELPVGPARADSPPGTRTDNPSAEDRADTVVPGQEIPITPNPARREGEPESQFAAEADPQAKPLADEMKKKILANRRATESASPRRSPGGKGLGQRTTTGDNPSSAQDHIDASVVSIHRRTK